MDINELITYIITPAGQVAVIMALAEIIKRQELFAPKFIFFVDLVLGVLLGYCTYTVYMGESPYVGIIGGLACGCIAAGVFSGVKNLREGYDEPDFVLDENEEVEEEDEQ